MLVSLCELWPQFPVISSTLLLLLHPMCCAYHALLHTFVVISGYLCCLTISLKQTGLWPLSSTDVFLGNPRKSEVSIWHQQQCHIPLYLNHLNQMRISVTIMLLPCDWLITYLHKKQWHLYLIKWSVSLYCDQNSSSLIACWFQCLFLYTCCVFLGLMWGQKWAVVSSK